VIDSVFLSACLSAGLFKKWWMDLTKRGAIGQGTVDQILEMIPHSRGYVLCIPSDFCSDD